MGAARPSHSGWPGDRQFRRSAIPATSNTTIFYRSQADAARARSDEATLQNVKDNHLRAAAAWDVLAARSDKSDRLRAEEALRKANTILEA